MCYRVTCKKCSKPTYKGCGRHVEQVLSDVPVQDRCSCPSEDDQETEEKKDEQSPTLDRR